MHGMPIYQPHHPLAHPIRQVRSQSPQIIYDVLKVTSHHLRIGFASKRIAPRERKVKNATQRVEVSPAIQRLPFELFRRHEVYRSIDPRVLIFRLSRCSSAELGQTKVQDLADQFTTRRETLLSTNADHRTRRISLSAISIPVMSPSAYEQHPALKKQARGAGSSLRETSVF